MKVLVLLAISLMFVSTTVFAGPGEAVEDQNVFNAIRERYNGLWTSDESSDDLFGENLKDGSILIELAANSAELVFFSTPLAGERIQYIPSFPGTSYLNYFDRLGSSINCGLYSQDLKKDPFPKFKCRLTVDAKGNILPFMDRSELTSSGKPAGWDGVWETDTMDFHWRRLTEIKGAVGVFSVRNGPRTESSVRLGNGSVAIQIFGALAQATYDKLDLPTTKGNFGPNTTYTMKTGKQIWCLKVDGAEDSAKCRIVFDYAGGALPAKDI